MCSASLMPDKNMPNFCLLKQRIVNGQHCPAGVTEHGVDPLFYQGVDQYFCTGFFGHW
jgi:hypothetical protein